MTCARAADPEPLERSSRAEPRDDDRVTPDPASRPPDRPDPRRYAGLVAIGLVAVVGAVWSAIDGSWVVTISALVLLAMVGVVYVRTPREQDRR